MNAINRRPVRVAGPLVVTLLASFLGGCSQAKDEKQSETNVAATPAAARPTAPTPSSTSGQPNLAQNAENTEFYAHLHQSYKDAVNEQTPNKVSRPPDVTAAGKKTADIWRQIKGENDAPGLWDQIRFMTPQGKRINYEAVIKTEAGEIHIELLPDIAPNHVRNFIALARAGYFDGLGVDYILKQPYDSQTWTVLLAGCPLATGEAEQGSIGYWLKPEITTKYSHEEGTVGSWPLENAACKFYINMTKAPWMDADYSVFGRICQGLDVARKLCQAPQQKDENGQETGYPQEPIIIQNVTIVQTTER